MSHKATPCQEARPTVNQWHTWGRHLYATSRQYFVDRVWGITTIVSAILALLLGALFTLVMVSVPEGAPMPPAPEVLASGLAGWSTFLAGSAVAASLVSGAEWSSGRYAVTFNQTPRRWRVVAAHSASAGACTAAAALPVAVLLLGVVHLVAAAHETPLIDLTELSSTASLGGVVFLSALGAGCAASAGSALGMLTKSRVAGTLIVAVVFFILPPVAAAAGMHTELLPVARWAELGSVPLSLGPDGGRRVVALVATAAAWPLAASLAAMLRITKTDLG